MQAAAGLPLLAVLAGCGDAPLSAQTSARGYTVVAGPGPREPTNVLPLVTTRIARFATDEGTPELVVSGASLIGLAFSPMGELVVTSNETAYRFD